MGAKENALWQIDSKKNGMEKAFVVLLQMQKTLLDSENYTKIMENGMEKN